VSALDGAGNESELTPVLLVSTNAADPVPLSLRIALGGDDAEQRIANGSVNLTSGDLELGFDGSREQAVGLRFAGLDVPAGATILSASLLFTADEVKTGPASLSIRGVAADDAPSFSGTAGVSSKPTTAASVAWSPPDWTLVGEASAAQRTPDLTAIVQEIVSRPGWAANQALAFVITGTGTRTAEAFEGRANSAPLLELVYIDQPDVTDPSTPENLRSPARSSVSIDLAWDASSDDRGVTGYRVAWPGGSTIVSETSWVATDLSPSTPYSFQVSALDAAANESAPTPPLVVSTLAPDLTDPSVPQNLHSPAQTGTTIELAWDPSSDNVGVTAYRVYGPFGATLVSGTSHVETGLVPSTPYSFQVSALDAAGNESDLSPALVVATGASDPVEFRVRIASGSDDVEEELATAALDVTSSDLELIQAGSKLQLVGMRFLGIPVPQGAHIAQAYIQFTVDETGSNTTNLTLRAELASNAAPFGNGAGLPSARTTTAAYATWAPPEWTSVGAAGAAQQTPDLAALIQEVVDQPGWTPGNALVLLVSGSGKRTAEAYDGVAASAPELVLVYEP